MEINFKRENISKVPFMVEKMKRIEEIYNNKKVDIAYSGVMSLIEIICTLILEKNFHEEVKDTAIITLAYMLRNNNELDIYNSLLSLISKDERIEKIDDYELNYLIISLDEITRITLEKYPKVLN